jgi:N utilization substance protein B
MLQGTRREARERALELLYEAEAKGLPPAEVLVGLPITPDHFAVALVTGVGERLPELDAHIERLARDWTVERMPWVDRSILRLAAFELVARPDVPTGAILSEAVELAKRFSTEEAGRFVNGLLANLAREVRPDSAEAPAP